MPLKIRLLIRRPKRYYTIGEAKPRHLSQAIPKTNSYVLVVDPAIGVLIADAEELHVPKETWYVLVSSA